MAKSADNNADFKTIKVTIEGISPLLTNPLTEETLDAISGKGGKQKKSDNSTTYKEDAAEKLYKNEGGKYGIPVENLLSCLVEAGRDVNNGKKQISTASSTKMYSFMSIEEEFMLFPDECQEWIVDKRRGVAQMTKAAVCIVRPKFKKWGFTLTLTFDASTCKEEVCKQLFSYAGRVIGLGDFRPQKRGPFGRFKIAKWEEVSNSDVAA